MEAAHKLCVVKLSDAEYMVGGCVGGEGKVALLGRSHGLPSPALLPCVCMEMGHLCYRCMHACPFLLAAMLAPPTPLAHSARWRTRSCLGSRC